MIRIFHRVVGWSSSLVLIFALTTVDLPSVRGDSATETQSRLLESVKYLASDELGGRGIGTEGLNQAADYIRDQFQQAGLDVTRIDGDAFQKFSLITGAELGSPNTLAFTGPNDANVALELDTDFRTCSFGGSGSFSGELVFCGYGIDAADKEFQEFEDVDVEGKVAIIMRRVPQQSNSKGPFGGPHGSISRHGDLNSKVSNAFRHGAVAVLFVNDPYTIRQNDEANKKLVAKMTQKVVAAAEQLDAVDAGNQAEVTKSRKSLSKVIAALKLARTEEQEADNDPLMKFGYGGKGRDKSLPVMQISRDACDRLLQAALKTTLAKLEAEIDEDLKPRSQALPGWTANGVATVERVRTEVKNVIGVLEGEGPLAEETIVVGAHYDHLGMGGEGSFARGVKEVHNGADDNASGASALIELARRLVAHKPALKRRIVFIAFTGEELGLLGSARYVKEPLFPLEQTIAMFNMDMVGRLNEETLTVFGTGTAPRWKGILEKLGPQYNFKLTMKPDGFGPSDHSSFYAKKIPVLHLFTGTHSDYHRPSDDWQKVNVDGMARVIDLLADVVLATANQADRPTYVEISRKAMSQRGGSRPYFGSIPDFGSEEPGYALSGVAAGSPAGKGGLKGGDRIVELGGEKIGDLNDFDLALRKFSAGDDADVVVMRNGQRIKLKVTLAKPR